MKIFIDSAQIEEIEKALSLGIIDGITTNPSLLKKAAESHKGMKIDQYIDKILKVAGKKPVSLEVRGGTAEEMVSQGLALYKRFSKKTNNVYIKIPIDPTMNQELHGEGIKAISILSKKKIKINTTLIFTPEQALLAAKAGAKFVSPFAGRIDDKLRTDNGVPFEKTDYYPSFGWNDNGHIWNDEGIISGVDLVSQIVQIFKQHNIKTEVLAASIRNPRQFRECALAGAHIATLPPKVIEQLASHPKTVEGMQKFTADIPKEYDKLLQ